MGHTFSVSSRGISRTGSTVVVVDGTPDRPSLSTEGRPLLFDRGDGGDEYKIKHSVFDADGDALTLGLLAVAAPKISPLTATTYLHRLSVPPVLEPLLLHST